MPVGKLNLSRAQLEQLFGPKPEVIKQFEKLFAVGQEVEPASDTPGISIQAANADAKANLALHLIGKLANDLITPPKNDLSEVWKAIHGLQVSPVPRPHKRTRYGQFSDTTTQAAAAINTPQAITFDTVDMSHGVSLKTSSEIEVDTEGLYNFQFSIQLDKTSGGTGIFYIWPRINGVDVANSASQVQLQGNNAEIFSAANFFFDLGAGDVVQFMFAVSDTSVQLSAFPATGFCPAIPSIILTVSDNIRSP